MAVKHRLNEVISSKFDRRRLVDGCWQELIFHFRGGKLKKSSTYSSTLLSENICISKRLSQKNWSYDMEVKDTNEGSIIKLLDKHKLTFRSSTSNYANTQTWIYDKLWASCFDEFVLVCIQEFECSKSSLKLKRQNHRIWLRRKYSSTKSAPGWTCA